VHDEAASGATGHQVRLAQLAQQRPGLGRRHTGQAGGGVRRDVRAGVQAEQPEQPRRGGAQRPVRASEDGPDVRGGVVAAERVQAVPAGPQFADEVGQRQPGPGVDVGGRDGQRERQPGAQGDEFVEGLGLGREPLLAQAPGQQPARLLQRQQVQRQGSGAVDGHQAGELVAAGDHREAAGGTGQQRAHLVGVPRVVQDHEYPLAGQQAAVQVDLRAEVGGDAPGRGVQRVEEAPHHLGRGGRVVVGVEAAQVGVELPVREVPAHPVRPVHGQGGLADPGGTGDGRDHHGAGGAAVQDAVQPAQLLLPPGERGEVGGQLRRGDGGGARAGDPIAAQDGPVHPLHPGVGVEARLVGEPGTDLGVDRERL
jgi:hypothetical protein